MNSYLILTIMFLVFLLIFHLFGKFAARLRGVDDKKANK